MKESQPKPNQLIVISKEASVRTLRLSTNRLRLLAADVPHHRRPADYSGGILSGTTNMPAVYSMWK
ncbi:hypothetical protein PQQ52_12380 [Paraburkholderia sediminicola]|uniref:hypothetical protein n=1 Tax=Paraburkholderia sediminicola TaxID=458836 RepID=UPI0038B7CC91